MARKFTLRTLRQMLALEIPKAHDDSPLTVYCPDGSCYEVFELFVTSTGKPIALASHKILALDANEDLEARRIFGQHLKR